MSKVHKNGCFKSYQHMPHAAFIGWCTGITDPEIKEAPCDLAINKVPHDSHVLTSSDTYIYKCYGYHKLPLDEPKFRDYYCGLEMPHDGHVSELQTEFGVKLRCAGNIHDSRRDGKISVNGARELMGLKAVEFTTSIPIDGTKECWDTEDHDTHFWGVLVPSQKTFHYICPGRDEALKDQLLRMEEEAQHMAANARYLNIADK